MENKHCPYCNGLASIVKKCDTLQEECDSALPCFACNGSGGNEWGDRFEHFSNFVVTNVGEVKLDPDNYCPKRRITLEFDYVYEAQQDGRPPSPSWTAGIQAIQLGKKAVIALTKAVFDKFR